MLGINNATKRAILDGMIAVGGTYETTTVRLYKEAKSYDPEAVLADYVAIECDFAGYAASAAVVWGDVFTTPDDQAVTLGDLKQFNCTDAVTPNDVSGYFLVAGGVLVGAEAFDEELPAREANQAIPVLPRLSYA